MSASESESAVTTFFGELLTANGNMGTRAAHGTAPESKHDTELNRAEDTETCEERQ